MANWGLSLCCVWIVLFEMGVFDRSGMVVLDTKVAKSGDVYFLVRNRQGFYFHQITLVHHHMDGGWSLHYVDHDAPRWREGEILMSPRMGPIVAKIRGQVITYNAKPGEHPIPPEHYFWYDKDANVIRHSTEKG